MVASTMFLMRTVMMGMMAVMMHGPVCVMGAGTCMHVLGMSMHGAMRVGKSRTGGQKEENCDEGKG